MKGRSYGWKQHLLITAGIVGIVGISCIGCGKERDAAIEESGIEAEAVSDNDVTGSRSLSTALYDILHETNDSDEEIKDSDEEADYPDEEEADFVENSITSDRLPLTEEMFSYEVSEWKNYVVITGVIEEYQEIFWERMAKNSLTWKDVYLQIPEDIDGLPVWEIGENAFANEKIERVTLPDSIREIKAGAFKNTGISGINFPDGLEAIGDSAFANCNLEYESFSSSLQTIGDRAFAGNPKLWTVLVPNVSTEIGDEAFLNCGKDFLLCYGDDQQGKENLVAAYAKENGFDSMEIHLSKEPVVHYSAQPLVLKPEVRNFFYGDDGEDEQWCTWEEDEAAPNFGYPDWQWSGCSSWCGVRDFMLEVETSSELSSKSGRYSARNVVSQNRESAWAENAEGSGIGESITYRQSCTEHGDASQWKNICWAKTKEPMCDGFMRYTEICIVNGYARDEKVWEENGRIKELLMYVENRPYAYLELEDTILPQYFALPEDDIKVMDGGTIEVRFEITQIYPGSLYEDTCLTGLVMEFSGRYAH